MSRAKIPKEIKRKVYERASGLCEYCISPVSHAVSSFAVDHILPVEKGGKTIVANLVLSCQGCNSHKYTKIDAIDHITNQKAKLFNPRRNKWEKHFAWNNDCSLIIGITPIGPATVEALKMNRNGVVNLRQVLYMVGKHPPEVDK